jgi:hypothetical protein
MQNRSFRILHSNTERVCLVPIAVLHACAWEPLDRRWGWEAKNMQERLQITSQRCQTISWQHKFFVWKTVDSNVCLRLAHQITKTAIGSATTSSTDVIGSTGLSSVTMLCADTTLTVYHCLSWLKTIIF